MENSNSTGDLHTLFRTAFSFADLEYQSIEPQRTLSPHPMSYILNSDMDYQACMDSYDKFTFSQNEPHWTAAIRQFGEALIAQASELEMMYLIHSFRQFLGQSEHPNIKLSVLQKIFELFTVATEDDGKDYSDSLVDWQARLQRARTDDVELPYMLSLSPGWHPGKPLSLNCVGVTQVMMGMFKVLGLRTVAVLPTMSMSRELWNIRLKLAMSFLLDIDNLHTPDQALRQSLERELQLCMIEIPKYPMHICIAVDLGPECGWYMFDPYLHTLGAIPSGFAMNERVALLDAWRDRSPGIEIAVGNDEYAQELHDRYDQLMNFTLALAQMMRDERPVEFNLESYARCQSVQYAFSILRDQRLDYEATLAELETAFDPEVLANRDIFEGSLYTIPHLLAGYWSRDDLTGSLFIHPKFMIAESEYALGLSVLNTMAIDGVIPEEFMRTLVEHSACQTIALNDMNNPDKKYWRDYGKLLNNNEFVHTSIVQKWRSMNY